MANSEVLARLWREAPEAIDEQWLEYWVENGWSSDITWRAIEGAPDDVGLMHGSERLTRYYQEFLELFENITVEVHGFVDVGEKVVARQRIFARSRSGVPVDLDYAVVVDLDPSGRIVAGREYATEAEALQAAERAATPHESTIRP